jgi:hypothetical protein
MLGQFPAGPLCSPFFPCRPAPSLAGLIPFSGHGPPCELLAQLSPTTTGANRVLTRRVNPANPGEQGSQPSSAAAHRTPLAVHRRAISAPASCHRSDAQTMGPCMSRNSTGFHRMRFVVMTRSVLSPSKIQTNTAGSRSKLGIELVVESLRITSDNCPIKTHRCPPEHRT